MSTYTETKAPSDVQIRVHEVVSQVYLWMFLALTATAVTALVVAMSPTLTELIVGTRLVFIGLLVAEVAVVWGLSALIGRMSATAAAAAFFGYALLNGLTLSVIFLAYTATSISTTFFATAGTFGVMSVIGWTTKRDLTSIGNLLGMALVGLVIASVVNLFWADSTLYWVVTYAGIVIFVGLTAYDTQKIKTFAAAAESDETMRKMAILGALALYLDFINLFLLLLRVLGRRR